MCLNTVSFTTDGEGVGTGYKIMNLELPIPSTTPGFYTPYYWDGPFQKGEWVKPSLKQPTRRDSEPITQCLTICGPSVEYAAGFHIFLKKEDALKIMKPSWKGAVLCEVKFKNVVAFGIDVNIYPAIVAREMNIVQILERSCES